MLLNILFTDGGGAPASLHESQGFYTSHGLCMVHARAIQRAVHSSAFEFPASMIHPCWTTTTMPRCPSTHLGPCSRHLLQPTHVFRPTASASRLCRTHPPTNPGPGKHISAPPAYLDTLPPACLERPQCACFNPATTFPAPPMCTQRALTLRTRHAGSARASTSTSTCPTRPGSGRRLYRSPPHSQPM